MIISIAGCSSLTKKDNKATAPSAKSSSGVPAMYYDFGDVLVPKELKVDKKSSFIYQTEGFSAGVLVLKGRIETSSLISFFENNMAKDNWQSISTFKSERTMLLFQKAHRWCVINITDQTFNTYVEIWVAPTTRGTKTGLLK
jgi:translation initiation factor IF-2